MNFEEISRAPEANQPSPEASQVQGASPAPEVIKVETMMAGLAEISLKTEAAQNPEDKTLGTDLNPDHQIPHASDAESSIAQTPVGQKKRLAPIVRKLDTLHPFAENLKINLNTKWQPPILSRAHLEQCKFTINQTLYPRYQLHKPKHP